MEMQRTDSEVIQDMHRLGTGRALQSIVDETKAEDGEFPSETFRLWRTELAELDRAEFARMVRTSKRAVESWEWQERTPSGPVLRYMEDLASALQQGYRIGEILDEGLVIVRGDVSEEVA